MNKTVLVTGASGFVGAHLSVKLNELGYRVFAVCGKGRCPEPVRAAAAGVRHLDLCDKADTAALLHETRPAFVVHAAALALVSQCEAKPELAHAANVLAVSSLLEAIASCGDKAGCEPPFLVSLSTDLVYDAASPRPGGLRELDDPPTPHSSYARTKLAGERLVRAASTPAIALRSALVYGEKIEDLGGFMEWTLNGLRAGSLALFTDEWRTPVWVDDIVLAAHRLFAESERRGAQELVAATDGLLHLAGPDRVSRAQLGALIAEIFDLSTVAIRPCRRGDVPSPTPRPEDVSLNTDRLRMILDMHPSALRAGLEQVKARSVR